MTSDRFPFQDADLAPTFKPGLARYGMFLSVVLGVMLVFCQMGSALGPVASAGSVVAGLALLVINRQAMHAKGLGFAWLGLFPAFLLLTTVWSAEPGLTFYYAIQLLLTAMGAYALWVGFDLRGFVGVAMLGALLVCLVSLGTGTTGPSTTGPVLIGITGSKNAMSSAGNLAVLAGLVVLLGRGWAPVARAVALLALVVGGYIVATTHAMTEILLTVVSVPLFWGLWLVHRVPGQWRLITMAVALVAALPGLVVAGHMVGGEQAALRGLGKDERLTGRAYLWQVAGEQIAEAPVLGQGYKSLWMSYSPPAIGMLHSQSVTDPRTFSMHQTYLESRLDGGLVGEILLIGVIAAGTLAGLVVALVWGDMASLFLAVFMINLAARSFFETLYGPFYIYFTLLLGLAGYAVAGLRAILAQRAPAQPLAYRPVLSGQA